MDDQCTRKKMDWGQKGREAGTGGGERFGEAEDEGHKNLEEKNNFGYI